VWEFDCKRLDKIHIYAFTVCTVICRQTMSLRCRKKWQHCKAQRGKKEKNKSRNVKKAFLMCTSDWWCEDWTGCFENL